MRRQELCCKQCGSVAIAEFEERADFATQMKALKDAHAGSSPGCAATVARFVLRTSTWSDDAWSQLARTTRNNVRRAERAKAGR